MIVEARGLINEELIFVDTNGIIIASSDEKRIGDFHEGALIAFRERRKLVITTKDEKMLKGVRAGINLPVFFNRKVIGVIGITGDPDTVSPYGELLRKMTELFIQESHYSNQLEWEARAIEAFVFDWIQLKEWSSSFYERGQVLNLDLQIERQVIIIQLEDHQPSIQKEVWHDIKSYLSPMEKDILVRWGNDRFLLLLASSKASKKEKTLFKLTQIKEYLTSHMNLHVSIGVGQMVHPQYVSEAYIQAERALQVAKKTNSIIFDEDLRFEMCLQEISKETKQNFVSRSLHPILSDEELLQTLRVFFEQNQSYKKTAEFLHIHINTLHYRLKKIEELTQLNPKHFHDLVNLYIALIFLDEYTKVGINNMRNLDENP
jgi:carbohydrate diacid regulator